MISVYYLFEKLSVNQHIYANTELERRVKQEKDPERKKKLLKARDLASEKASAEAWKREPAFMKDEQKDRQARRLRRAAYDQTTRPDLEADIARKVRMGKKKIEHKSEVFKKRAATLGTAIASKMAAAKAAASSVARGLREPMPSLGGMVLSPARAHHTPPRGKSPTPGKVIPFKRPNVPDADIIRRRRRQQPRKRVA